MVPGFAMWDWFEVPLDGQSMTGWWYTYPSEKYEFVSWDDDIPNWMESHKIPCFQTTNQIIIVTIQYHHNQ